jgi:hypothetical protein
VSDAWSSYHFSISNGLEGRDGHGVPVLLRLIADHLEVLGNDLVVRDITFRVIDTADDPGIGEMTVYYDRDGLNHDGDVISGELDSA